MTAEPSTVPAASDLAPAVDGAIRELLEVVRAELHLEDPAATPLVEEIERLIDAGGKRLRPAFCYWGYRAAGAADGVEIVHAAASLELLHTMALIHDDVMDRSPTRRGVDAVHVSMARAMGPRSDASHAGMAAAVIAGDLAAVLADRMMLESGMPSDALERALGRYHAMRIDMAAGQFLDLSGATGDATRARRVASLKGGGYTVEGPLLIGAALASAAPDVTAVLSGYGAPLGEAFQLRDDLEDREGVHGATRADIERLVADARGALSGAIDPEAAAALDALAMAVRDA